MMESDLEGQKKIASALSDVTLKSTGTFKLDF